MVARKIIDQLFQKQNVEKEATEFVTLKDWKVLISRLDQTQAQVETCSEKVATMYSKVMQWLSKVRGRLDQVSQNQEQLQKETKEMFEEWKAKWGQPEERKEDQRRMMDLMQRHTQFLQSYNKEIDAVKKSVSKNEYQVYQLLEQMRTVSVELDLINQRRQQQTKSEGFSTP